MKKIILLLTLISIFACGCSLNKRLTKYLNTLSPDLENQTYVNKPIEKKAALKINYLDESKSIDSTRVHKIKDQTIPLIVANFSNRDFLVELGKKRTTPSLNDFLKESLEKNISRTSPYTYTLHSSDSALYQLTVKIKKLHFSAVYESQKGIYYLLFLVLTTRRARVLPGEQEFACEIELKDPNGSILFSKEYVSHENLPDRQATSYTGLTKDMSDRLAKSAEKNINKVVNLIVKDLNSAYAAHAEKN